MKKKLLLIDGYSIICRVYYALPLLSNKQGQHTNACLGFFNIFYKVVEEEKPDYIAVAFDENKNTFRHKLYKDYKGKRSPMPEELKEQVPYVKDILNSMNIKLISMEGFEADDILGTLSYMHSDENVESIILSGDRDMLQLASQNTKIRLVKTLNNKSTTLNYYSDNVYDELKVTPTEFIDVKALMGDQSDNIPGATGVGEKTAFSLIEEYKSIDNMYRNIDNITKKKLHETLVKEKDDIYFYKKLVTIVRDVPLDININDLKYDDLKSDNIKNSFLKYEIFSIYKRLGGKNIKEENDKNQKNDLLNLFDDNNNENINNFLDGIDLENIDNINVDSKINNISSDIIEISNEKDYKDLLKTVIDYNEKNALNFCFYIDIKEKEFNNTIYIYFNNKSYSYVNLNIAIDFLDDLLKILSNKNITVYTYDLKKHLHILDSDDDMYDMLNNKYLEKIHDISLMRYMINPVMKIDFNVNNLYKMYNHIQIYIDKLKELKLYDLYINTDLPLSFTLYNMEKIGIEIDKDKLKTYEIYLSKEVNDLEIEIKKLANLDFNIKSPKQLSEVLFDKLNIEYPEKNNKKSTSAEILEKIIDKHPIIEKILKYRTYTKLLDTYAIGLKKFIGVDDRIHTSFNQVETATGRLSSENPNLQNIPIRTDIGKKLRDAFIPRKDYVFIDADYSQIELRIMSILSNDVTMINDFKNNVDIHSSTASKIFKVDINDVDNLMRRKAKAVNFGLIYGISSYGLSEDLHISSKDAKKYMDAYFETYKDIRNYLDNVVENAKSKFYTKTYYNRIRPIYEFKTGNPFQKAFAKRVAMNSPIQGTASDIIKMAMVNIDNDIKNCNLKSRLVLQVHDEILIECHKNEIDIIKKILYKNMRDCFNFIVKLDIDINTGSSWGETH